MFVLDKHFGRAIRFRTFLVFVFRCWRTSVIKTSLYKVKNFMFSCASEKRFLYIRVHINTTTTVWLKAIPNILQQEHQKNRKRLHINLHYKKTYQRIRVKFIPIFAFTIVESTNGARKIENWWTQTGSTIKDNHQTTTVVLQKDGCLGWTILLEWSPRIDINRDLVVSNEWININ